MSKQFYILGTILLLYSAVSVNAQVQNCGLPEGSGGELQGPEMLIAEPDMESPGITLSSNSSGLPTLEYIITNPNSIIPDPDSTYSGPEVLTVNGSGTFTPSDYGLGIGDQFCVTAISYDLPGMQELLDVVFNDSIGIASCCQLTELTQMVDLCGNLDALGVSQGSDLEDFSDALLVIEAYGGYRTLENFTFIIDSILNPVAGLPCTAALPACFAFSNSVCFDVDNIPTGIFDISSEQLIAAFPNPVTDLLSLNLELAPNVPLYLELYDVQGKLLTTQYIKNQESIRIHQLDMQKYSPGLYFLRLSNETGISYSQKIVKEN